jgi:hypothetical protein
MIRNDLGVEARCFLDEEHPVPEALPDDYFESQAEGRAEGVRVEREAGLGRDALAAIANLRPRDVMLAVGDDGSLVISGSEEGDPTVTVNGPGFEADRPGTPIVVPYMVALALYDGAVRGRVDVTVDARHGRLHRADQGITVEWSRR